MKQIRKVLLRSFQGACGYCEQVAAVKENWADSYQLEIKHNFQVGTPYRATPC